MQKVQFIKSAEYEKDFPGNRKLEVAMIGKSNVGKSSFINKFTNRKSIARVSKTPGCTQLINFFMCNEMFYLVDLPGYGFAKVPPKVKQKWQGIIEGYLKGDREKIVFLLIDVKRGINTDEEQMITWLKHYEIEHHILFTKIDKLKRNELALKKRHNKESFFVSSLTGEGIEAIFRRLEKKVGKIAHYHCFKQMRKYK